MKPAIILSGKLSARKLIPAPARRSSAARRRSGRGPGASARRGRRPAPASIRAKAASTWAGSLTVWLIPSTEAQRDPADRRRGGAASPRRRDGCRREIPHRSIRRTPSARLQILEIVGILLGRVAADRDPGGAPARDAGLQRLAIILGQRRFAAGPRRDRAGARPVQGGIWLERPEPGRRHQKLHIGHGRVTHAGPSPARPLVRNRHRQPGHVEGPAPDRRRPVRRRGRNRLRPCLSPACSRRTSPRPSPMARRTPSSAIGPAPAASSSTRSIGYHRQLGVDGPADDDRFEFTSPRPAPIGPVTPRLSRDLQPRRFRRARGNRSTSKAAPRSASFRGASLSANLGRRERAGAPDYTAFNAGVSYSVRPHRSRSTCAITTPRKAASARSTSRASSARCACVSDPRA